MNSEKHNNNKAWLAVDKDGTEKIFNVKPFRGNTQKDKWSVVLLAINTVVFAWRKLASAITRKPVAALAVVLAIMTIANLATYASMKAKLTTAEWRYDRLRIHMDSVYEAYNIHSSYSRLVEYK